MPSFKERLDKVRGKESKERQGSVEDVERIVEEVVKYYEIHGSKAGTRNYSIPEDPNVAKLLERELKNAGFAVRSMVYKYGFGKPDGSPQPQFTIGLPPYCNKTFRRGGNLDQLVRKREAKNLKSSLTSKSDRGIEKLRKKMRLKIEALREAVRKKREQGVEFFVDSVIKDFGQLVESTDDDISPVKKTIKKTKTNLDLDQFNRVAIKLEELGFDVERHNYSRADAYIIISLNPKKRNWWRRF